jgi:hypothetical protein
MSEMDRAVTGVGSCRDEMITYGGALDDYLILSPTNSHLVVRR